MHENKSTITNIHKEILAKTLKSDTGDKPGLSVFAHCLIVGIVCREIINTLPQYFTTLYNLDAYPMWCALHDIGKASPGFQNKLNKHLNLPLHGNNIDYVDIHEYISCEILNKELHIRYYPALAIIERHHGYKRSKDNTPQYNSRKELFGSVEWINYRKDIHDELVKYFISYTGFLQTMKSLYNTSNMSDAILNPHIKYLSGLLCVSDWIASDSLFDDILYSNDAFTIDNIESIAKTAIEKYGIKFSDIIPELSFDQIFDGKFPVNSIQKTLHRVVDNYGLYIVEAPMGKGKTEAALWAAYKAMECKLVNGIYFALPTQTTSNSMLDRYKQFISKISNCDESNIRLIHGKAVYHDHNNSGMRSWFHGNKKGTLSQFGLGTIDQALMSVLGNMKHFFLRSYGLSNKCIILDEMHSYDVYTKTLNNEMISQLIELQCVVIVLSATLTTKYRGQLIGRVDNIDTYPLISKIVNGDVSYYPVTNYVSNAITVTINHVNVSDDMFIQSRQLIIDEVIQRVNDGEMVLWIENTISDSQLVYNQFSGTVDCGLLHSRFSNEDRNVNESKWVKRFGKNGIRNVGCVLVSTQVCEQSIDIDADYLVTALCPIDMLIQRLGRLHRHINMIRNIPTCTILIPSVFSDYTVDVDQWKTSKSISYTYKCNIGKTGFVYKPYILKQTHRVLSGINSITLPNDIRSLIETTYNSVDTDIIDSVLHKEVDNEIKEYTKKAINIMNNSAGYDDDNSFVMNDDVESTTATTRIINQKSTEVLLIKSSSDAKYTTYYNDVIDFSKKMSIDDRKSINKASIKINDQTIVKYSKLFRKVEINRESMVICLLNDGGYSVEYSTKRIVPNIRYNASTGFIIE